VWSLGVSVGWCKYGLGVGSIGVAVSEAGCRYWWVGIAVFVGCIGEF